ncbi:MAG TPA: DsrE family protein [Anaerolineaceae bacterium]|nr:DsrE family protein [Anaerolineaceae bacterium]
MNAARSTAYLITSYGMGQTAAGPLKEKLIKTFLTLLEQSEMLPGALCFYTDGVRLVCAGSPVLEELARLEKRGVRLIICQTCLNDFQLTEQFRVGIVGGMADILTVMQTADSVITI